MAVFNRLRWSRRDPNPVAAMASAAARLLRAYATQVEALRRLRNGDSQTLRVEHVHVNKGGTGTNRKCELHSWIGPIDARRRRSRPALPYVSVQPSLM